MIKAGIIGASGYTGGELKAGESVVIVFNAIVQ